MIKRKMKKMRKSTSVIVFGDFRDKIQSGQVQGPKLKEVPN